MLNNQLTTSIYNRAWFDEKNDIFEAYEENGDK